MTGKFAAAERQGLAPVAPPLTTAMGALLGHITGGADAATFQPMNVNFGLFPPLAKSPSRAADGTRLRGTEKTMAKRRAITARALGDLERWNAGIPVAASPAAGLVPAEQPAGLPEPHLR